MDSTNTFMLATRSSHPNKRTSSEAGLNVNADRTTKTVKRRAPQACESCRVRKVRCNVTKHGKPCSNCTVDEIDCVVGENRRKKKRTNSNALHLSTLPEDVQDQQDAPLQHAAPHLYAPLSPPYVLQSALPAYIKPLPDRFGADDIMYLRNKGALGLPEPSLRNELLRCYIDHMHPFMPFLDWQHLLYSIEKDDAADSISLLLLQAVMFAGVATIELHFLQAAGFSTRREARRVFFTKIRLLYDLDYEDDSITLIQALLLMTYWRENPNGRKETHHWIEIAVSLSRKVGLHRDQKELTVVDPERRKLCKRIWWSVYMRDAEIALGTRRSTLVKDLDFDTPMLHLEDFNLSTIHDATGISDGCESLRNEETQRQLATLCVEKAKLCLYTSHTLSLQFNTADFKGSYRTASMIFDPPLKPGDDQLQAAAHALKAWEEALPQAAQLSMPISHGIESGKVCLLLNASFLHLLYFTTLFTLHRSRLLPPRTGLQRPTDPIFVDESRRAVWTAATKITTVIDALQSQKLVRYLPSPTITLLLPAIVVHLQGVLSLDNSIRRKSLQDYCKCMDVMAALRDMYAAADYSTAFLQAAVQRTEIGPVTLHSNVDRDTTVAIPTNPLVDRAAQVPSEPAISELDKNRPVSWSTGLTGDSVGQHTNDATYASGEMTIPDQSGQSLNSASHIMPEVNSSLNNIFDGQPSIQQMHIGSQRLQSHAAGTTNDSLLMNQNVLDGATAIDLGNDFEARRRDPEMNSSTREKILELNSSDLSITNDLDNDFMFDGAWVMGLDAEGLMLGEENRTSIME